MEDTRAESLPIGAAEAAAALQTLQRYKAGKAALDKRLIDNELWFRMGHWKNYRDPLMPGKAQPSSGWLFNSIANKHADAMDNYPEPMVLPRAADDQATAQALSSVLPVVLEQADYEQVYSDVWWRKLKQGTGVKGIFWDPGLRNGVGDISIKSMDLLMMYWEPGVMDIQDSPHLFSLAVADNEQLKAQYPQLEGHTGSTLEVAKYIHDQSIDTSDKSVVVDWYYKKLSPEGRSVLHYCKFCNGVVLYASENDPALAERGFYDHGKYPFVFDVLFPEEGTPCGYGYVDLCKSPQKQIDLMNQAILKNTLAAATPRFFIRSDGAVNENEYADWTRPFVHTNGNLGADSIAPIHTAGLDSVYVAIMQSKIAEMKETAGNRDVANGGTASGVTAATAIAALQEAGGKLSRNMIDDGYEAFSDVVTLVIELIRQFYQLPRQFRLLGAMGREEFVSYDGQGLREQVMDDGTGICYRVPEFDLEVSAQDENPYKTMEYNQLALQLFQMGFFREDMADQALRCLELMDFKNKDQLTAAILQGKQQAAMAQTAEGAASGGGTAVKQTAMERMRQQTHEAVRPR